MGLGFFQRNNPVVRHVVLRKRSTLEELGLPPRIPVDVHPLEGQSMPGLFDAVLMGVGLTMLPRSAGDGARRVCGSRAANLWIREVYLPEHNRRFARPAALPDRAFVAVADKALLIETLCIEKERIVARDNTVIYGKLKLQIPERRVRAHYVKARVRVREYLNGALAIFHGPRCIARKVTDAESQRGTNG